MRRVVIVFAVAVVLAAVAAGFGDGGLMFPNGWSWNG